MISGTEDSKDLTLRDCLHWLRADKTLNIETLRASLRQAGLPLSLVDKYAISNSNGSEGGESLGSDRSQADSLMALVVISDLAFDAFAGDTLKTAAWVVTPNHLFLNLSPFEMAAAGRAVTVVETLLEWLGAGSKEDSPDFN